eukprot:TRINITY_DN43151_c0_g1_i1.p1 TRINITY_DN43151_c0_g1~~TRINITY_DN43151_c0_g1_i1.p1  ORF type:complete len:185 (-),score=51.82 TRINITY_DN43151_c0_g1_i1:52-606(-)
MSSENEIERAYLQLQNALSQVVPESEEQVLGAEEIGKIFKQACSKNLTLEQLQQLLGQANIHEEYSRIFLLFWKNERVKLHNYLVSKSSWNGQLEQISWRIDVKTAARGVPDLSQPTALVEMVINKGSVDAKRLEVVQFEMNRQEVDGILRKIDAIQQHIGTLATDSTPTPATPTEPALEATYS